MKGKIKILSLVLALTMVASSFAACKSTPSGEGESKGEDKKKVEEISWYIWGVEPNQPEPVIKALNEMSSEDIGIKVNFKWQTDNYDSLLTALSTGDKDIDIAFACAWFADYVGSAQKNYFMDLTDILPKEAPDLYKKLPQKLWDGVKVNGKIYGVPTWKDAAATNYWLARKDILQAADATAEFAQAGRTVASLTPTLEKIKAWHDADPVNNVYSEGNTAPINFNKNGLNGHDTGWDGLHNELFVGVKIVEGNTTVQSYFTDPDYVADLKTLKDWADRGLSNGKVALQVEQEYPLLTVGTAQGWDGAQFTAWGGPVKGYDTLIQQKSGPFLTSATVQGGVSVVGAGSQKSKLALKYLEYANTNAKFRNMLTYGIEGVNWELKDGLANVLTGQDWAPGNFALGSYDLLIPGVGCPPDMYTKLCDQVNTAQESELLGFVPSIANVENEIATCVSLIKEVSERLRCGAVQDVDAEIAALLKKIDAQGYSKIIADYQQQVDAFLAAKK